MVKRSIEVWCSATPFDRLPADIRDALRPGEMAAYRAGPAYFAERAERCAYRPMRKFFRLLGSAGALRLHLYGGREPVYTAYFGFNLWEAGRYVQVRLGPAVLPGDPPPELAQVYQDIDGTIDGHEYHGGDGWESAADVQSVAARQWQPSDPGGCDPAHSYPVYGFGNGDYAGYAGPRRGFMYTHEEGGRLEAFKLLDWAEEYFGSYAATFRT